MDDIRYPTADFNKDQILSIKNVDMEEILNLLLTEIPIIRQTPYIWLFHFGFQANFVWRITFFIEPIIKMFSRWCWLNLTNNYPIHREIKRTKQNYMYKSQKFKMYTFPLVHSNYWNLGHSRSVQNMEDKVLINIHPV